MRIGRYWEGQGGIYAGLTRKPEGDFHLVVSPEDMRRDLIHHLAKKWANGICSDGHKDFRLPTPPEAALLYANLKEFFEDRWYWTIEPYPADELCAWVQTFGYGRQADARMTDACRARAVRVFRS